MKEDGSDFSSLLDSEIDCFYSLGGLISKLMWLEILSFFQSFFIRANLVAKSFYLLKINYG